MVVLLVIGILVGGLAYELTSIFALALSVAVGVIGFLLDALNARARSRRANLAALWPEVLDSVISSTSSGSSITESLIVLATEGPVSLRPSFVQFQDDIERGQSLSSALRKLKHRLGNAHSDRLLELLGLVSEAGGAGLLSSLREQVRLVRQELAFSGEIASKLGWITGTAKIAVGAPWLIVAMLSTRPENAAAYASTAGSLVLIVGLFVSVFAFKLVQTLGVLPESPRVFA
jgi:tight adherence protein B